MRLKNIRNLFLSLALLAVVALVSYKIGQGNKIIPSTLGQFDLSLMWKVKDKLSTDFLEKDDMDNVKMKYGAIQGMVASLGDPYTVFLPPEENKSANEDLAGEFGGVGISLGYSKDGILAVVSPLSGTPADKAGIKAGDLILKIVDKKNNIEKETTGISLNEAVSLIRGEIGTEVVLTMYRESNQKRFESVLKRDNIEVPGVELEWLTVDNKKIAWVKMSKFSEDLFTKWNEIVTMINNEKKISGSNYAGIILDLRNNPGGYLQASVVVASDFIKDGVIVKQESTKGITQTYNIEKNRGNLLNDKLVVLINGGSASASEILAGALHDYKRASLVGVKTFGKGTVQQPEDFNDGSGLHLTIARWLLPSGKNIHKEGISPDIEIVESTDSAQKDVQLEKAKEVVLEK
ncbi:MAG: S41 family peptidase [Candidatus Shapirobacteria bacterium]|nr:S41 family peptidase [Candidatus Shapirobacteria bacterium]